MENQDTPQDDALVELFLAFVGERGAQTGLIDGRQFAKMMRDTGVLSKKFTTIDVDIIFAKAKDKSMRKLNFQQFRHAIEMCAEKKGLEYQAFVQKMTSSDGPVLKGTRADSVSLHDNKAGYTGVYARGGPSTVDEDRTVDFSTYMGRQSADVRGVVEYQDESQSPAKPVSKRPSPSRTAQVTTRHVNNLSTNRSPAKHVSASAAPAEAEPYSASNGYTLKSCFRDHTGGSKEMDGRQFAKLMRDCRLVDKKRLTTTDVDLIFVKCKERSSRKISFAQFNSCLEAVADKKGVGYEDIVEYLLSRGGPVFRGVKTDNVRLHDDKMGYTGVYKRGGPSVTQDDGAIHDISSLCDRTPATVRGVKQQ